MSLKLEKNRGCMPYQALLDRNRALEMEIQDLKIRLEEAEELRRAISEGDLDALIIRRPKEELVFTLDSADRAYRVLVETMNEGTATLATDGTILYCNRQFAELTKMPSNSVVGASIYGFIASEDTTTFKALLKQQTSAGELKLRARDGTSIPVYLSISSLQSEGSPNAWCLVVTDLTEQKKNEEIVAAERLARLIIEQAAEAIVVCDTSGKITRFSNAVSRICECDPTFQKFEDIVDLRSSEVEDAGKSIFPVSSALKGDTIIGMEAILEVEDCQDFHQKLHLLLNSGPLKNSDGKIVGCVVTLTDITEREQLEERTRRRAEELATVMETAPVAIWISHNPQCHNITGNRMANEFYEAETGENVSANITSVRRFFCKGCELTADELPMQQASLKDIDMHNVELDVLLPSGEWKALMGSASPLHDDKGNVRGSIGTFIEITERKRAEEALARAKEQSELDRKRLEAILEVIPSAIVLIEASTGSFSYMNRRAMELYGVDYVGFDLEAHIAKVHALRPDGTPYPLEDMPVSHSWKYGEEVRNKEMTIERADGTRLPLLVSSAPLFDAQGNVTTVIVAFEDITERKQMEKELREGEEKYRNIIETANEGIWIVDPEARTTYVNKRMAEMLGCTQEEMIGKSARLFTDEESTAISQRNMEKRRKGINESHEFKLTRRDGSSLWTLTNAKSLFDKNGKFVGSMSMLTDITKRKEAEVKLKETLDNLENLVKERTEELEKAYSSLKESEKGLSEAQKMAHLGNWHRSLITDEIYWSDEMYRIFGFRPQEFEVTFDIFINFVHPEDRVYVENNLKKALNGEPYDSDYRIITANGTERIIHSQGEVVFDEKNAPTEIRGTLQDITERKMAEEALEKMDKIRIKEIHHRIKNNLQVICSLLSLEAERFSDEKIIEAFKESQSRVTSMALIHEELYRGNKSDTLDFAVYLHKFTKDLFSSYNLGGSNISLKTDLEQVYLDMDAAVPLGIIVNELISNSLKHAFPAGSEGEIQISLLRADAYDVREEISGPDQDCREKGNFQYIIRVADNGKGIPDEIEIENADSLGLQLVNILIDQIDGCIALKRDCGTDFTIWFGNA